MRPGKRAQITQHSVENLPPGAIHATAHFANHQHHTAILSSCSNQGVRPPVPTPAAPTTLQEFQQALEEVDQWAINSLNFQDNGDHVAQAIQAGTARAVSDGSYKPADRKHEAHATAGFCLHGSNPHLQIVGDNCTPGYPDQLNSYRAELGGITGIVTVLELLCKLHQINDGSITVGLDNEGAVQKTDQDWPLKPGEPCYDMLTDLRKRIQLLPITVNLHWVKGHQDDHQPTHRLDWWARQNVKMDKKAKKLLHKTRSHPRHVQTFRHQGWSLSHQGRHLAHCRKGQMYHLLTGSAVTKHWQARHEINLEAHSKIYHGAIKLAHKTMPQGKRRWLAKHSTGHCAVGRMMLRRREWTHSKCPVCGADDETATHVLQCQAPAARAQWNKSVQLLSDWMVENSTMPALRETIIYHLHAWSNQTPTPHPPKDTSRRLLQALADQSSIGWSNFMLGRHAKHFADIQQRHFESLGKQNTGLRWASALILKTYDVAWDMWQHRNSVLHNKPNSLFHRDQLQVLDSTIHFEFNKGPLDLLPGDRFLLRSKTATLSKTLTDKQLWVSTITLARAAALETRRQDQLRQQNFQARQRAAFRSYWETLSSNQARLNRNLSRRTQRPTVHSQPPSPLRRERQGLHRWLRTRNPDLDRPNLVLQTRRAPRHRPVSTSGRQTTIATWLHQTDTADA